MHSDDLDPLMELEHLKTDKSKLTIAFQNSELMSYALETSLMWSNDHMLSDQ